MSIDDPGPVSLTVPEALEAIGNLAGLERRADPGVLLRVLLEHMIVFHWNRYGAVKLGGATA